MKTHALETLLDKAVGIKFANLSNKYELTMAHPPPPPPPCAPPGSKSKTIGKNQAM